MEKIEVKTGTWSKTGSGRIEEGELKEEEVNKKIEDRWKSQGRKDEDGEGKVGS